MINPDGRAVRCRVAQVGTPHWCAPEVLRQERYDERADVYR